MKRNVCYASECLSTGFRVVWCGVWSLDIWRWELFTLLWSDHSSFQSWKGVVVRFLWIPLWVNGRWSGLTFCHTSKVRKMSFSTNDHPTLYSQETMNWQINHLLLLISGIATCFVHSEQFSSKRGDGATPNVYWVKWSIDLFHVQYWSWQEDRVVWRISRSISMKSE